MQNDFEALKKRMPLLEYLQRQRWTGRHVGSGQEYVGLCPLHEESHPSFYVNAYKNLFFCHGCGYGGDLIRFVQLYLNLSFRDSVLHLEKEISPVESTSVDDVLGDTVAFYQGQLQRHDEALQYLEARGVRDQEVIHRLRIGYAAGGNLRRHLTFRGYPSDLLFELGLINSRGCDAFWRRITFPCLDRGIPVNLYGRSIAGAPPHRFLPRPKGELFAWETARTSPTLILVEGLFDLAALWQAGFLNTTCALGTHLTPEQFNQLCDQPGREVFITFDSDSTAAGQKAARKLAQSIEKAGLTAYVVQLPEGHDPNSYFLAGASAADFAGCLHRAQRPNYGLSSRVSNIMS
jgi:DNA primase